LPTIHGLLVVLEAVDPDLWPTSGRPHVAIGEDDPVSPDDHASNADDLTREERRRQHAAFRSLLTPSREVPRFDPLFDPPSDPVADPAPRSAAGADGAADGAASAAVEDAGEDAAGDPEAVRATGADAAPEAAALTAREDHEAFRQVVASSRAVPRFEPLEGAGDVPGLGSEIVRRRRTKRRRSASHSTRPRPVGPGREVPDPDDIEEIEDLDDVGDLGDLSGTDATEEVAGAEPAEAAGLADVAADVETDEIPDETPEATEVATDREPGVPEPARASAPEPAPVPAAREQAPRRPAVGGADKRETLILVGVIAVLILLGAIYAAAQKSDRPHDSGAPQGASLVTSQPVAVRA
jgi:hypothetical protein